MNTITPLFLSYLYQDIDDNFLDSLDAILYLNPPTHKDMQEVVSLHVKQGTFGHDVQYSIMDMLNLKLIDNFRRIYAANNKTPISPKSNKNLINKYTGNTIHSVWNNSVATLNTSSNPAITTKLQISLSDLQEQQNKIYKIINVLFNKLIAEENETSSYYRNENRKYYKNAILGKDVEVTSFEMFAYLSLHESLSANNRQCHTDLLKKQSQNNSISWTFASDYLIRIIRKGHTEEAFNTIVENLVSNNQLSSILNDFDLGSSITNNSWNIGVVNYLLTHHTNKNINNSISNVSNSDINHEHIYMTQEQQLIIAKTVIENKMLDDKKFARLVSDPEQFKNNLNIMLDNENLKVQLENVFAKSVNPEYILQSKTAQLFLNKIERLTTPNLLFKALTNKTLSRNDKEQIAQLYDLSNQELIQTVAYSINNKKVDINVMKQFVSFIADDVEKQTLAYIISLNANYMEFCKPIYMHIRVTEKTNEIVPIRENQESVRKNKI